MSHINEGLLHAHLDGALGPDERRAWAEAEAHLEGCPDCRRRLEEAREMRDAAAALLSSAAAPAAAARPAFEELLAQAEARASGGGDAARAGSESRAAGPGRGRQGPAPWWRAPAKLAWAASLVLAVGAGWIGRQLVVEEGGEVAVLTRAATPDADRSAAAETEAEAEVATPPASRADPRLESDRVAEARRAEPGLAVQPEDRGDAARGEAEPRGEAEALVGATDGADERGDAAPGAEADVRLQTLATKAAGARCYAAAQARERSEGGGEAREPPAGASLLRLGANGTATLQLENRPLVGFWEPGADSLHARVTDGTEWFDLRLAETENGLRGSLQPAARIDGADRAAAADAGARGMELVDAVCPGS